MAGASALVSEPRAASGRRDAYRLAGPALVLVSLLLFLLNTHQGIGILPDTTRYMRLGPMSYDAPLYTWALDAIRALGIPFGVGAKTLALVLVCANTLLIWHSIRRGADSLAFAAAGTAFIILAPQFSGLHAVAMSEGLHIGALLLLVLCFVRYLETDRRIWLVACGVALGIAMLARFTAAPMAIALAALLLLDPRGDRRRRVGDTAILAAISGAMFFGWAIVSKLTTGQATGRDLAFNGNADLRIWLSGLDSVMAYLLPGQVPTAIRVALLVVVVGATGWLLVCHVRRNLAGLSRGSPPDGTMIPLVWGLFAALYVPFIWLVVSIEANIYINGRYLLPLFIAVVIAATGAAASQLAERPDRRLGGALIAFTALILAIHGVRTADQTASNRANGIGYARTIWAASPVVAAVRALPPGATIFSNAPDLLNYLTPRKTKFVPLKFDRRTGREDPDQRVADTLAKMQASLAGGDTYVVFVDAMAWRYYLLPETEVTKALGLKLLRREADGRVYGAG